MIIFENKELLTKCLACLNPSLRNIVTMYYIENYDISEISSMLNIPNNLVLSEIKQALKLMKEYAHESNSCG